MIIVVCALFSSSIYTAGAIALLFMLFGLVLLPSTWQRQRRLWGSFRIALTDELITRQQEGAAAITIRRDEVTRIVEHPTKALVLYAAAGKTMYLPPHLNGYDELVSALRAWQPFDTPRIGFFRRHASSIASAATLAGFAATFWSTTPYIFVPTGFLLLIALIIWLIKIQRSPLVEQRIKKQSWIISLPMFGIILRLWYYFFIS
jgi:hypothetical protein